MIDKLLQAIQNNDFVEYNKLLVSYECFINIEKVLREFIPSSNPSLYELTYQKVQEIKSRRQDLNNKNNTPPFEFIVNLKAQDDHFTGRENLLTPLNNPIQVFTGLGGSGKTALALEYAWKNCQSYAVVWVAQAAQFDDSCVAFFNHISHYIFWKITVRQTLIGKDTFTTEQLKTITKRILACIPSWLLIIDDAKNQQQIATYLPTCTQAFQHIIITTRYARWDEYSVTRLNMFNDSEAFTFLNKIAPKKITAESAKSLAAVVGYFPLPLLQAGSYIRRNSIQVHEYIELHKAIFKSLWKSEEELVPDQKTFNLLLAETLHVIESNLLAKKILHSISLLLEGPIPKKLFFNDLLSSTIDVQAALNILLDYSLLEYDSELETILAPKPIQMIIRSNLSSEELVDLKQTTLNLITAALLPKTLFECCANVIARCIDKQDIVILNQLRLASSSINRLIKIHHHSLERLNANQKSLALLSPPIEKPKQVSPKTDQSLLFKKSAAMKAKPLNQLKSLVIESSHRKLNY